MLIDRIADALIGGLEADFIPFETFCAKYLRHHFPLSGSEFHDDLKARLQDILKIRGVKDNWMAPRGSAKSTIISLAYILYCICTEQEKYIILVSDTHGQSVQFLADIKIELETNYLMAADYPAACGKGTKWSTEEIITRNNIKIDAMGMRGKIRGRKHGNWRPTLIICDDPENDESVVSPRQRERTVNWLMKGAVSAGVPDYTNVVVLGTVINADCLVQTLDEGIKVGGWRSRKYMAIIEWPDAMDLWDEWRDIYWEDETDDKSDARTWYEDRKEEMDAGAKVLWEVRESLYSLMCLRCEIGNLAFESEKQNAAVNPEQCRFDEAWFDGASKNSDGPWYDELPQTTAKRPWRCIGACDPSLGKESKRGDFCAIMTVWFREGDRFLYVDADLERRPSTSIIDRILQLHTMHNYEAFGFEINGFQTILADVLADRAGEQNKWLPMVLITHTKPKRQRIDRLAMYLEPRYLKFKRRSKGVATMIKQLKMHPIGDHDDGPDCLEMVINIIERAAA